MRRRPSDEEEDWARAPVASTAASGRACHEQTDHDSSPMMGCPAGGLGCANVAGDAGAFRGSGVTERQCGDGRDGIRARLAACSCRSSTSSRSASGRRRRTRWGRCWRRRGSSSCAASAALPAGTADARLPALWVARLYRRGARHDPRGALRAAGHGAGDLRPGGGRRGAGASSAERGTVRLPNGRVVGLDPPAAVTRREGQEAAGASQWNVILFGRWQRQGGALPRATTRSAAGSC